MDPAGVPSFEEPRNSGSLERQHPAEVPAGNSEYTRLQRVEHRQQQVRLFDFLDELGYVGDAQRGGDDRRGSGGYAVGREDVVVWSSVAGEPLDELGTNSDRQLRTGHHGAAEVEDLVLV